MSILAIPLSQKSSSCESAQDAITGSVCGGLSCQNTFSHGDDSFYSYML